MKIILLNITLLLSALSALGQKEDLKKLNAKLNEILHSTAGLHIQYSLVVIGNGAERENDSIKIDLYKKSNEIYKIDMGNVQTLLHCKNKMLKINHLDKVISIETDTNSMMEDQTLLDQLKVLIDSSSSVIFLKVKDDLVYNLIFESTFGYSNVQLTFSSKTHFPKSINVKFNADLGGPYYSISVTYNLWDMNWIDKKDELQINSFVEKNNGYYQPVAALSNYKIFRPEEGR